MAHLVQEAPCFFRGLPYGILDSLRHPIYNIINLYKSIYRCPLEIPMTSLLVDETPGLHHGRRRRLAAMAGQKKRRAPGHVPRRSKLEAMDDIAGGGPVM